MLTEAAPPVLGDRRLIERAVLNLIENALQAVAGSGVITVSVSPTEDGRGVCVAVSDDGPGLDAAAQRRAFEPFFSTKKAGSGLGLTLVRKTALDHGGDVRLESNSGRGTRAVLTLPARPAGPATPRGSS
jgi:two-component system nitrogen regulation sensor histidine kinase NtrY